MMKRRSFAVRVFKCHFFPGEGNYSQQVGLGGGEFMKSLAAREPPVFLWFPIVPESHYMVYRFTGALIMGVDLSCVMVIPEQFSTALWISQ